MKRDYYFLTIIILGLNIVSLAEEPDSKELFPVFGVTLGVTTESELAKIGKKNAKYKFYKIRGQNFWFKDGVFDHMYLTRPSEMPLKWMNFQFSWYATYKEWLVTLKNLGFDVQIAKPPKVVEYKGKDSFFAELIAEKHGPTPIRLKLEFGKSEGTTEESEGTLYSIRITQP